MLTKPQRPGKERTELKKPTPVRIVSAVKAGSVLTITFNQAVTLRRGTVPAYTVTGAAVTAASAVLSTPTVLAVTFTGAVTSATFVNIPFEDPAVRSQNGGFVADTTFPVT